MARAYSDSELESKSLDGLRSILADDELFQQNDEATTDYIVKISKLILLKEDKSSEQREAEFEAFCSGLIDNHGYEIPLRFDKLTKAQKSHSLSDIAHKAWFRSAKGKRRTGVMVASVLVLLLIAGNVVATYAFNVNILHIIISYSDSLFSKTVVEPGPEISSNLPAVYPAVDPVSFSSMQEALDSYSIESPRAPGWMPDGFTFIRTETAKMPDITRVSAIYGDGTREIIVSVVSFEEELPGYSRYFEKNDGPPVIYMYNGIEHYFFRNINMLIATWTDGLRDCHIQGEISETEMKSILHSMYREDEPK